MKTFVVEVMHCRPEITADRIVTGAAIVTLVGKDGEVVAAFPVQSLLRIFEKSTGAVDKG